MKYSNSPSGDEVMVLNVTMDILQASDKNHSGSEQQGIMSQPQKYFLAVLILALINGVLGIIYYCLKYRHKRRSWFYIEENSLRVRHTQGRFRRRGKRKYSTHIALAASKSRESARRMSSYYL